MEVEAGNVIDRDHAVVDESGRRQVVRTGYLPKHEVMTVAGQLEVEKPRAQDLRGKSDVDAVPFRPQILPPYLRRSKNMEELIRWLRLRGISTGGFEDALKALVGSDVPGLSAITITRLVSSWAEEHEAWSRRDLSEADYVYFWTDGIHFNIRLEEDRQRILVLMGARNDGKKELLAISDGYRESEQNWQGMLIDLKHRGLRRPPKIAVGNGALGFCAALRMVFPETTEKGCWGRRTANILKKMPKSIQAVAKADLHEIWMAETKKRAEGAFDLFNDKYEAKYPKAAGCLAKDRDVLLAFYDFSAEHWLHLRTTNPFESTFATVRLRQPRTKGSGARRACLGMVFKLALSAQRKWRRLNGYCQLLKLKEESSIRRWKPVGEERRLSQAERQPLSASLAAVSRAPP